MSSKKSEARERVKAMREEQAKKELKQARMMRFGIGGAILAAVLIIAVAVAATRGGGDDVVVLPDTVTEDGGGITDGSADAPVTIDVWVDFLCPHCKTFEQANGPALDELVDAGQAKVVYHPVTFTGGVYSGRANNAFACAVAEGELRSFKTAAFAAPSTQWTNNSLVDLGESIGLGDEYKSCVRDDTYGDWSTAVLDRASEAEISGTPTIFVNGTVLDSSQWTPEGITAAVTAAAAGETPGATPPAGETPAATPPAGETPAATPAASE